ncbi:MAG TPA: M2 family metallopeptidase, partial [Woeseiaceae bacterium]|nr:M2 family metallopeptidase [Woeseiaceae bacterium]
MTYVRSFRQSGRIPASLVILAAAAVISACSSGEADSEDGEAKAETAEQFVDRVNQEIIELAPGIQAAAWVRATYITPDTALLNSLAKQEYAAWHSRTVQESLRYADEELAPETARALGLLKLGTSEPAPGDPAKRKELSRISTSLTGAYGAGEYCPEGGGKCLA